MTGTVPLRRILAMASLAAATAAPAFAQDAVWPDAPWRAFATGSLSSAFLPVSLAAGDLDGDGDVDVLVGQSHFAGHGVSVLLNRGDGTYLPPVFYPSATPVGTVALADVDGDGDRDAFATLRGQNDDDADDEVSRFRDRHAEVFASRGPTSQ